MNNYKLKRFINAMNDMFKENDCTDGGRITVDYCDNANLVIVKSKSFGGTSIIDPSEYTTYGLMLKVMTEADYLYNKENEKAEEFEE